MKILCIGDLHVKEWPVFPAGPGGLNGYLRLVETFLEKTIPAAVRKHKLGAQDAVVLLGDVADEPYKKGTIGVATLATLVITLETLATTTAPVRLHIIEGNHDQTTRHSAGGTEVVSWLDVLPLQHLSVCKTHNGPARIDPEAGHPPVVLVPYAPPKVIEAWLADEKTIPPGSTILGHFVTRGTKMDNGRAYSTADAVDPKALASAQRVVMGHAHTPQLLGSRQLRCVGVPLPYSWHTKHVGNMLLLDTGNGTAPPPKDILIDTLAPQFVGPWTWEHLQEEGAALRAGSFVRLLIGGSGGNTLQLAREAFPSLRIAPVLDAPSSMPDAQPLGLPTVSGAIDEGTIRAYMAQHQAEISGTLDEDELRIMGRRLLGLGGGAPCS